MMRFSVGAGRLAVLVALLCAPPDATASEPTGPERLIRADTAHVHIPTPRGVVRLDVEIAATPSAHTRGLMGRARLAPHAGMLFVYQQAQEPDRGFWMYRTRIALDIAFLDADGHILVIFAMEPCASRLPWRCPGYRPGVSYRAALEVNRGFFAQHDIGVGDRIVLPADLVSRP